MRDPAIGSRKFAVPTATRRRRRPETPARRPPTRSLPSRSPGSRPRRPRARTCSSATARIAGPERPPLPAPSQGPRVAGSIAVAFSVLISETASAPPASAAMATAPGSATFGVSFTISGLAVSGRSSLEQRERLVAAARRRSGPTPRSGTRRSARGPRPRRRSATPLDQPLELVVAGPHHRDDQRDRQLGEHAAGRARRKPSRPLFGSPIELIIPAGVSKSRGGGLPARGSGVIVFETNAENGKSSSRASPNARRAAIASKVPDAVQHRVLELRARPDRAQSRPHQCPDPGTSAVSISRRVDHRPVHAQAHVAAVGQRDRAARSRHRSRRPSGPPWPARRRRPRSAHMRAHRLEHRGRPAGVDGRALARVVALEQHREQVGDVARGARRGRPRSPAGPRSTRRAPRRRPSAPGRGSPSSVRDRRPRGPPSWRAQDAPAARGRSRRRRGSPRRPRSRARSCDENGRPSGPVTHSRSPCRSPASRSVPGPTASTRKSSRTPPSVTSRLGDREGAGQVGPAAALPPNRSAAASM